MRAGDSVWTPPGQEHWHGGTASTLGCHIALLADTDDGDPSTWLEPVIEAEYAAAQPFFRQAIELGITFWDTASSSERGTSEELVHAPHPRPESAPTLRADREPSAT